MGLNRETHYKLDSRDKWHALGDRLAPKEPWRDLIKGRPGLRQLVIMGLREENSTVQLNVSVEPSLRVDPGVFVRTNEHYAEAGATAGRQLMAELRARWDDAQAYAKKVGEQIVSQV
jgi:hypothetical protein